MAMIPPGQPSTVTFGGVTLTVESYEVVAIDPGGDAPDESVLSAMSDPTTVHMSFVAPAPALDEWLRIAAARDPALQWLRPFRDQE